MRVFSIDDIALSVEEPAGNLVLSRVLDDSDETFELFGGKFTGAVCLLESKFRGCGLVGDGIPLVEVDIGLLADQVGVSATNTLDLGQGVHDLLLSCSFCQTAIPCIVEEG